jgi:glycosyltransferase involved in cell wall biosynthesis
MRVMALVHSPDHVCCRYRITPFRALLEQAGHTVEPVALPKRLWSQYRLFRRLRGANVLVQRSLLPRWQVALLRGQTRRLLFDIDDAVFLRDSYSPKGVHHPRRLRRFMAMVRACDAVIVGNRFLQEQVRRWTTHPVVPIIPTCVDPALYPIAQHRATRSETYLVWVGSSSTLRGLEQARLLFEEVGKRVPGVRLKVISDRTVDLGALPVVHCPWQQEREAADIASGDIGITWVPDDLWSRGKCGLKALQYMAAGLPVVANPVGVHGTIVRDGVTGCLAETPNQWVHAIARLAANPELRGAMGRAGRQVVEAEYSVAHGATLWRELLEDLERPLARVG